MPERWSLRKRLLAIAAASIATAWLAGGAAVYYAVQREDRVLFDARLADLAQTLLVFADHEIAEIQAAGQTLPGFADTDATAQGRYRYQIWSRDGQLLLASRNAPGVTPLMPLGQAGLSTQLIGGAPFRVIALEAEGGRRRIQAAEPVSARLELDDLLNGPLLAGLAASALLLGLLTALLLRLALRPVHAAAAQIAQRGPADLRAVTADQLPDELRPVLAATNQVMQRVDVALRSEREFVAAAAHELRTPLGGLRAQAQLAAHPRASEQERGQALQSVLDGVDHAAHLVTQLLDLARSDVLAGDPHRLAEERQPVDLAQALDQALAEIDRATARRTLRLSRDFQVAQIRGSAFGLGVILRNLLSNAMAHTPDGGELRVASRQDGTRVLLMVEDSGPGIPPSERRQVFERFRRVKGTQRPGCGLGLAIVKTIAEAHRASLELGDSALGGLRVEISFEP